MRGFLFSDDHFFIDLERARGILEGVVRADLGITISKLQIRADTLCRMDREFFELMVRAGVKRFTVGIESGSQRILDLIKKDITVEEALEANRRLAPYPFVPLYLFMMGMPTETPEDLGMSIQLADRMLADNPRAVKTFNIYTPYPGTELFSCRLGARLADAGTAGGLGQVQLPQRAERLPVDGARDQAPCAGPGLPADVPRQPVHRSLPGDEPPGGLVEPAVRARSPATGFATSMSGFPLSHGSSGRLASSVARADGWPRRLATGTPSRNAGWRRVPRGRGAPIPIG